MIHHRPTPKSQRRIGSLAAIRSVRMILSVIVQTITQARAEYEARYARKKTVEEGAPAEPAAAPETAGTDAVPAPEERSFVPRVVMQVSCCEPPLPAALEGDRYDLVSCRDGQALLEEVMHRTPDAVIYALHPDCREDLGILRLMRRAAPDVPLVLLAAEDSLDTRRVTQALRPIYYAVCPADGAELRDVVHTALSRRGLLSSSSALTPARSNRPRPTTIWTHTNPTEV